MAKITFKNMDKVFQQLTKRFDDFTKDSKEMEKVAKTIRSELVSNIRKHGRDANDKPLPTLRKSTISKRKQIAKYNKTLKSFSPAKSNLTITGGLLRSLRVFRKVVTSGTEFIMQYTGNHKPYKDKLDATSGRFTRVSFKSGSATKNPKQSIPNSDIINFIKNNKYNKWWSTVKFYGVTKRAKNRINKQFRRYIRRRRKK